MMDRQSKENGMTEKQLQDFLDKGGKIQYFKPGERTEEISYKSFYGRKPKKEQEKK
jgi:hypothetical protein